MHEIYLFQIFGAVNKCYFKMDIQTYVTGYFNKTNDLKFGCWEIPSLMPLS